MLDYAIWMAHSHGQSDSKRRKAHLASVRARLELQERVARLEDELSWTSLVASALAGICIEKGLVTPDELKERLNQLDAAHSDEHGGLAPASAPTVPPPPPSVAPRRRFVRRRK